MTKSEVFFKAKSFAERHFREILFFNICFIFLFFNLGGYPNHFEHCVADTIRINADKVINGLDVSDEQSWIWMDMHQHGGGQSPVFSFFIETGLRLFGLTLFGVRLFPTLIAFALLVLMAHVFTMYFPKKAVYPFLLLLVTSPWYLTIVRTGSIVGFGFSLTLFAFSMLALMMKKPDSVIIPIITGIAIGLSPYGHTSARLFPILFTLWIIINIRKHNLRSSLIALGVIALIVSFQFTNWEEASENYFAARGESLFKTAEKYSHGFEVVFAKIVENIGISLNMIFGLNRPDQFLDVVIMDHYWGGDAVVYPKYLVPFFMAGLGIGIFHIIKAKNKLQALFPYIFLGTALFPGILAGIGWPNPARGLLAIIPIYYFIILAFYSIMKFIISKKEDAKKVVSIILLCVIGLTAIYQGGNFYLIERPNDELRNNIGYDMADYLLAFFEEYPDHTVLVHTLPFYIGAYTMTQWLGGNILQEKIDNGQIVFWRPKATVEVEELVKENYFDVIISPVDPYQHIKVEELEKLHYQEYKGLRVFNVMNVTFN